MVKGAASPDDPALGQYWADRRRKVKPPLDGYTPVRVLCGVGVLRSVLITLGSERHVAMRAALNSACHGVSAVGVASAACAPR